MEQNTKPEKIIIVDSLDLIGKSPYQDYLSHALCTEGTCRFMFNGKEFEMKKGDVIIVRKGKLMEKIHPDKDFRVVNVMVESEYITSTPVQSNYGVKGQLALFLNPVMHLTPEEYDICMRNFENIRFRLSQKEHRFREEMLKNALQAMILDFFDFHSHLYEEDNDVSVQSASIMSRFLNLLESGAYRRHREVAWYADQLCITPKYLSEVTKEISGFAANFWINRYTVLEISRLLQDKSLTFVQISDMLGFSSPAYFTRYVQKNLGANPTEYRN